MHVNNRRIESGSSIRTAPSPTSGSARFHQAKDLLTDWFGVSPEEAENLLLTWSCETRMSACELATALVCDISQGRPTGCNTEVLRHLEHRLRGLSGGLNSHLPAETEQ